MRNPKYPDSLITLRQVLTQTSSITDGLEVDGGDSVDTGYNSINGTNIDCSLQDLLDPNGKYFVKETYSNYAPGTHWQYSNLGCGILACIVEKATGKYFTEYIKEIIFKPLELDASFVVTDIKSNDVASTYVMRNGEIKKLRDREKFENGVYKLFPLGHNFRGPAGGCFISTNGLMKIMQALLSGGAPIIKESTLQTMMQMTWTGKRDKYESYTAKGLQLMITDYFDNRRLYGHFGDAYGVKSHFLFNKKEQFGMIFITNGGGYKYQECGYSNVQEKLIKETLDKYWNPTLPSVFKFNINEKETLLDYLTLFNSLNSLGLIEAIAECFDESARRETIEMLRNQLIDMSNIIYEEAEKLKQEGKQVCHLQFEIIVLWCIRFRRS